jgi:DNA end-binding protein Ku
MSRPIWSGLLHFGLVTVPVDLLMAVHEKTIHFHMLSKDGSCRLRRKLYCPESGKEYDFSETARGIEVAPDEYALVDQQEINRLKPEKGRAMEIVQFAPLAQIDPVYFDRVYYLKPGKEARKPYKLLLEAMRREKKCAIARFVMREREYLAAIRPMDDGMVLHTLNYADEVESLAETVGSDLENVKVTAPELNMGAELMKSMTRPLKMNEFNDEFRQRLQELIDAKVKGKELAHVPEDNEPAPPRTINLMEALKKSLAAGAGRHDGHARRRSA